MKKSKGGGGMKLIDLAEKIDDCIGEIFFRCGIKEEWDWRIEEVRRNKKTIRIVISCENLSLIHI